LGPVRQQHTAATGFMATLKQPYETWKDQTMSDNEADIGKNVEAAEQAAHDNPADGSPPPMGAGPVSAVMHRQALLVENLRLCSSMLVDQQRDLCRRMAALFDVEYRGVFKGLHFEYLEPLHRRLEPEPLTGRRVMSEPLELDTDTMLQASGYDLICEAVELRYKQVADGLRGLLSEHDYLLHIGWPEAHMTCENFTLTFLVSCPVVIL